MTNYTSPSFKRWSLVLIASLLVAAGCGDDGSTEPDDASMPTDADEPDGDSPRDGGMDGGPEDGSMAEPAALAISVTSLDGYPVEGAKVALGDEEQTTDAAGRVSLSPLEPGRHVARVAAEGYAPVTVVSEVAEEQRLQRRATLRPQGEPLAFDAEADAVVTAGSVRLHIPGDSFVDGEGEPVTGEAQVTITPLDPTGPQIAAAPGPFQAIHQGETEPEDIESFFMAHFDFTQDSEPISVADGESVELEYVLPESLQDAFAEGEEIENYWFDEDEGLWREHDAAGEVRESTYATGRLAWFAEVDHFTWWNCDAPWTDKNCLRVTVLDDEDDAPVSGATVEAHGVSYNGTTTATTGSDGIACVNYKRDSTVEVAVTAPSGYIAIDDPVEHEGNATAATCAGEGDGDCDELTFRVAPPTCIEGTVVDGDGAAVQGANVYGWGPRAEGGDTVVATTETGADGTYCLEAPQGADVRITALYTNDDGELMSGEIEVTAADTPAECGGDGGCTEAPDLAATEPAATGCITGTVVHPLSGADEGEPVTPGTPVWVYGSEFTEAMCDLDGGGSAPSNDTALLATGSVGEDGRFCVEVPVHTMPAAVVGRCEEAGGLECLSSAGRTEMSVDTAAECGSTDCVDVGTIRKYTDTCGEGP